MTIAIRYVPLLVYAAGFVTVPLAYIVFFATFIVMLISVFPFTIV
jgi:hypothetical protein